VTSTFEAFNNTGESNFFGISRAWHVSPANSLPTMCADTPKQLLGVMPKAVNVDDCTVGLARPAWTTIHLDRVNRSTVIFVMQTLVGRKLALEFCTRLGVGDAGSTCGRYPVMGSRKRKGFVRVGLGTTIKSMAGRLVS
jgi:hypothetical protein